MKSIHHSVISFSCLQKNKVFVMSSFKQTRALLHKSSFWFTFCCYGMLMCVLKFGLSFTLKQMKTLKYDVLYQ
jgi:hypothetical protein